MSEEECLLPTTEEQLDVFVASLIKEYALPEGDDTYDAIATMILHLPHTKAYATRSYFGNGVLKSMANRAAYNRLRELAKRREAKELDEKQKLTLVENATTDEQPVQNA